MKNLTCFVLAIFTFSLYGQVQLTFKDIKPSWSYYEIDPNHALVENQSYQFSKPILDGDTIHFQSIRIGRFYDGQYISSIKIGAKEPFFSYSTKPNFKIAKETNAGIVVSGNQIKIRSFAGFEKNPINTSLGWDSVRLKEDIYDLNTKKLMSRFITPDTADPNKYSMPYRANQRLVSSHFRSYNKKDNVYIHTCNFDDRIEIFRNIISPEGVPKDPKTINIPMGRLTGTYSFWLHSFDNDPLVGIFIENFPNDNSKKWSLKLISFDNDLNVLYNRDQSEKVKELSYAHVNKIGRFGYAFYGYDKYSEQIENLYLMSQNGYIYKTIPLDLEGLKLKNEAFIVEKINIGGKEVIVLGIYALYQAKNYVQLYLLNDDNTLIPTAKIEITPVYSDLILRQVSQVDNENLLFSFSDYNRTENFNYRTIISHHLFDFNQLGIISSTSNPTVSAAAIIYPNPATDYLTFSGLSSTSKVSIYATDGRQISILIIHNEDQIDVSQLPTGLYFLRVSDGAKVSNYKFMKQ